MSQALHARPDQIDALTRGVTLPLAALQSVHLEIIAERLRIAFAAVATQAPKTLTSGSEGEVTALLQARLNAMIDDDPLWGQLVLCAARGAETPSYSGGRIEKRPDLSLWLTNRNRNFPLVVEAKIIDAPAKKTIGLYCSKGLQRFIDGEYAWGCGEAFMLAYVRDGATTTGVLSPFLTKAKSLKKPKYAIEDMPQPIGSNGADLARSRHTRNFAYFGSTTGPGPIAIWHLWLS
ncbi:hypothetical protein [Sphingomonas baiyangensis]|uniref:hypothetical protein n=1 Tax=Sphingomonas baiyangensis TaxID=2572576 RepID=UPI002015E788|nr:hypothetical protein [Sphingomonas baiyangensis]